MEKTKLVIMTKKFIWLKVTALAFVLAAGCAPKPKTSEAKLNLVSSMAIADINMDGGAIVYGQQQDGPGQWAQIFRKGDDVVVDMPFGVWNFSVIAYSGPTPLSGTKECAVINKVNIADEREVIEVVISSAGCAAAGMRQLAVKRCTQGQFDSADPVVNCVETTGIESYRLRLMAHRGGKLTGDFIQSPCITETSFTGAGRPVIPTGTTNVQKQPFILLAYTGTTCDSGESYVPFTQSLSVPENSAIKAFKNGATGITLALNNDGDALDSTAPIVTMLTSSAVSGNGREWINQSTASSFNVSGACENGLPVELFLNGSPIAPPIGSPTATCSTSLWSANLDLSGLADTAYGAGYTVEARQTDGGGNVGSASRTFDKDTALPLPGTISSFAPALYNSSYLTTTTNIVGFTSGTDAGGSGILRNIVHKHTLSGCIGGPTWTHSINSPATSANVTTFTDGNTYSFRIQTQDFAGNNSALGTCYADPIIVDTSAPVAPTGVQFNGGVTITNDNTPNATWTLSASPDIASYEVELYNAGCGALQSTLTGIANTDTTYTLPPMTEGTYSLMIVAVDNAGQRTPSTCSNNVTIDTTPPSLPTSIAFTGTPSATLSRLAQITTTWIDGADANGIANYSVAFHEGGVCSNLKDTISGVAQGTGTASTTSLAGTGDDGFYKVQITVTDNAGNTNTTPCSTPTIQRDTTPPAASTGITWDIGATVYIPRMDSGTWTHDTGGGAVQVDLNLYSGSGCSGTVVHSNLAQPTTFTDFIFDVATEGVYSYGVVTRDNAGNNSTEACSTDVNFIQAEMGLGTRFWDAEVFSATRIYFVTHSGMAEIYDSSAFPAFEKQGAFKVNGFKADGIINFNNNYALLYDKSTGDMHAWKYTTPGTIDDPQYIGQINTGTTSIKDHAQMGSTLYLLDGSDNLHGIDLTTITSPAVDFASFSVGSGCNAIEVDPVQTYLYAGCGALLKPVDLSGTPTGAIPAHDPTSGMVFDHLSFNVNNSTLYGAGNGLGGSVAAIDTSTPTTPETSGPELTGTGNVLSLGNFDGTDGVICIDASPDEAHRLDVSGGVALRNRLDTKSNNKCEKALVTTNHTLSVSVNGASVRGAAGGPGPLPSDNSYMDGGSAFKITHDIDPTGTDYAAVGLLTGGVSILNTSNKRTPYQVAHIPGSNRAVAAGTGNILYALDGITLRKYDMSTISSPGLVGSIGLNGFGPTFSPENQAPMIINPAGPGYAYIGGQDGIVAIANISGPSLVSKITSCSGTVGNHVRGLSFINNILVVACLDGDIFTYNLVTPATPVLADSITATKNLSGANQEAVALARADDYFYTALEDNGIDIFQVNGTDGSITDHPDFDPTERITSLFRSGTDSFMYAATANSVIKINMASNTSLSVGISVSTPVVPYELVPAQDLALDNPLFLYMATGYGGVQVIDSSRTDALFQ